MNGTTSHCVQLLNSFIHHGPNGKHFVMVFEILGVNFLEIIKRYDYKGVPIPLVRKLARQCLIGLDYLHRMCKIIHTDFKPENVVICLRDDEVEEIAKTGQLTTTKMFNNKADIIKKLNMKIAGTLPEQKKTEEPVKTASAAAQEEEKDKVWEVNMEGLTAKQKKNLRKKLQRQRRKQGDHKEGDEENETSVQGEQAEEKKQETVLTEISNQPANKLEDSKKKKHAKKASADGKAGGDFLNDKLNGLLVDDEE